MPSGRKDFERASKNIDDYEESQRTLTITHFFIGYERCRREAKERQITDSIVIAACANSYVRRIMG